MADDPKFLDDNPDPTPPPKAAAGKPVKAAGPAFRRDDRADANRRPVAILVGMLLLAGLVGIALAFPFLVEKPPQSRLLTLHVERYTSPAFGVADWAADDAKALAAAVPDKAEVAANEVQRDKLTQRLKSEAVRLTENAGRNRLVLSVAGLGAVRDGQPCLLPADASPVEPQNWVPLDDILAALGDDPTGKRLLLLDLTRPNADPFLGRPDDVAAAVEDHLKKRQAAGKLPCAVLVAASAGEVSLPAARARRSAFGLYLEDGIKGAAAGVAGTPTEVTVAGLARYVAHRVERYARQVHGRPQHPRLYEPAGFQDFTLVAEVKPPAPTPPTDPDKPPPPPAPPVPYPAVLTARWGEWKGLLDGGADRRSPEAFARLTGRLLRAERGWAGTEDAEFAKLACDGAFNDWRDAEQRLRAAGRPADNAPDDTSLARKARLAARLTAEPPADLQGVFANYLNARVDGKKADEFKEEAEAWKAKRRTPEAVRLVWRRLGEADPERAMLKVKELATVLADQLEGDPAPSLERELVKFLAKRTYTTEQGLVDFPAAGVSAWLKAEDALGRALAAGPVDFARSVAAMDAAEADRKAASGQLLRAAELAAVLEAVGRFEAAAKEFDRVTADRTRARPDAAVPGLLAAVLAHQPGAAAAGGDWYERWKEAADVLDELLGGRLEPARAGRAIEDAGRLVRQLGEFVGPPVVEKWEKQKGAGPDDLRAAVALVAGPVLPADARAKVWDAVRREQAILHDNARKTDADDLTNKVPPGPPSPAGGAEPNRLPPAAADRLLKLASGAGPSTAVAWLALAPRADAAVREKDWPAAARLVRVVPPAVATAVDRPMPSAAAFAEPAAADSRAYSAWLRKQWLDGYDVALTGGSPLWDRLDPPPRKLRTLLTD